MSKHWLDNSPKNIGMDDNLMKRGTSLSLEITVGRRKLKSRWEPTLHLVEQRETTENDSIEEGI